eukprot:gb/GECG01002998.1/.p1 GENE.gb/GECG01002998.1/~~gb/GECG01002998.1/.p1  ORF type:complete len:1877 (+),score=283.29 gb/GECG01002998.1/:1-5631(+)
MIHGSEPSTDPSVVASGISDIEELKNTPPRCVTIDQIGVVKVWDITNKQSGIATCLLTLDTRSPALASASVGGTTSSGARESKGVGSTATLTLKTSIPREHQQQYTRDNQLVKYTPTTMEASSVSGNVTVGAERIHRLRPVLTEASKLIVSQVLWNPTTMNFYAVVNKNIRIHSYLGEQLSTWYDLAPSDITCAVFDGQYKKLILGSQCGHVSVANARTGVLMKTYDCWGKNSTAHVRELVAIRYIDDNRSIVVVRCDRTLLLLDDSDTNSFAKIKEVNDAHDDAISACAVSCELEAVVTGSNQGDIHVWHYRALTLEGVCSGHYADISALEFIPGQRLLISADSNGMLCIWALRADAMDVIRQPLVTLINSDYEKRGLIQPVSRSVALEHCEQVALDEYQKQKSEESEKSTASMQKKEGRSEENAENQAPEQAKAALQQSTEKVIEDPAEKAVQYFDSVPATSWDPESNTVKFLAANSRCPHEGGFFMYKSRKKHRRSAIKMSARRASTMPLGFEPDSVPSGAPITGIRLHQVRVRGYDLSAGKTSAGETDEQLIWVLLVSDGLGKIKVWDLQSALALAMERAATLPAFREVFANMDDGERRDSFFLYEAPPPWKESKQGRRKSSSASQSTLKRSSHQEERRKSSVRSHSTQRVGDHRENTEQRGSGRRGSLDSIPQLHPMAMESTKDVPILAQWRTGNDSILGFEQIDTPPAVLTFSSDHTVRIWSVTGELLGVLARKVDEAGKKDNSTPVPWRFFPDERKLIDTKINYTKMMLERVGQLYERYQADFKLESQIEAEEQSRELEMVDELRRTGAGTGEMYAPGDHGSSSEPSRIQPPTKKELSDPKRRRTLITKLASSVSGKIEANRKSLREFGGLRGVHFNREEMFTQYQAQRTQAPAKRGGDRRGSRVSQEETATKPTTARRSSIQSASSVESGRALDAVVEDVKKCVVAGDIQQAMQLLRKYPEVRDTLPTHEDFPTVASLPHGFGELMDAIYEASLLGQGNNAGIMGQLKSFHETLEEAAANEGLTGQMSENDRQLALTQARKRLQREVNELIDAHQNGQNHDTKSTRRSSRRTTSRRRSASARQKAIEEGEDSEDEEDDDSQHNSEDSVASAIDTSVDSRERREDDDQPINAEDIDTGENDLFNSTAARNPAQNRRIEKVLDHYLRQQGQEPLVKKYSHLQEEEHQKKQRNSRARQRRAEVDTTPSAFLQKNLPQDDKDVANVSQNASRQSSRMFEGYEHLRLKLDSRSTNRSQSETALNRQAPAATAKQQLSRISSAPFFETSEYEEGLGGESSSPSPQTRQFTTSSIMRTRGSGDFRSTMKSRQTGGSKSSLVRRAMRLTDQLSEQHLQKSGEQSPLFGRTTGDDEEKSAREGSRGSGSSNAQQSGISDSKMKGLFSDVQTDPVMSRLVNHLFSERVLGTVQQISSAADSLEQSVSDAVRYLEVCEKERQENAKREAVKVAKGERQRFRQSVAKSASVGALSEQESEEKRQRFLSNYHKALGLYHSRYQSVSSEYLRDPENYSASETPASGDSPTYLFDEEGNLTEATKKRIPKLVQLFNKWTPVIYRSSTPEGRSSPSKSTKSKNVQSTNDLGIPAITHITQAKQRKRQQHMQRQKKTSAEESVAEPAERSRELSDEWDPYSSKLPSLELHGPAQKLRFPKFGGSGSPAKPPAQVRGTSTSDWGSKQRVGLDEIGGALYETAVEQYSPRLQSAIKGRLPRYRFGAASAADVLSVKALFDLHDSDRDGKIDVREFVQSKAWDKSSIGRLAATMFDSIDSDADGFIRLDELLTVVFPHARPSDITSMVKYCEGIYDSSEEGDPSQTGIYPRQHASTAAAATQQPASASAESGDQPAQGRRKSVTFQEQ